MNLYVFDTHNFFQIGWNWTTDSNINEGAFRRKEHELTVGAIISATIH